MSDVKISQFPYIGNTGYTPTDLLVFVNYLNPTGTTNNTKIDDVKDYVILDSYIDHKIYGHQKKNWQVLIKELVVLNILFIKLILFNYHTIKIIVLHKKLFTQNMLLVKKIC